MGGNMRGDHRAVAGFFEDLPVLIFVLSGVMALVLTSTFVAERIETDRFKDSLDALAQRIVNSLSARMQSARGPDLLPTAAAISAWNYSEILDQASEGRGYLFALSSLHPSQSCRVTVCSDGSEVPETTGHARRLVNALDDRNVCVVLEVSVIVW